MSWNIPTANARLDRGQTQDWFNSTEILVEATISGLCFYLFAWRIRTN